MKELIIAVERATSPAKIPGLKKLKGHSSFFRVRVGDYRIGIVIKEDLVVFVRVLNRKDIYKYFP